MHLYTTDQHVIPLPPGHKFPIRKYTLLRRMLEEDGYFQFRPAPFSTRTEIELVHGAEYVDGFLNGTLSASAIRRIGFPWSDGLVQRTLASVGGTVAASRNALLQGWGGTLAGGTHHAFADEGSGFCVFNDIAVAIRVLRSEDKIRRAAVIDVDVHQGDGTAHIFRDDPDVLTLSLHCKNNFPLRKQQSKIDVELDAGTSDEAYLARLAPVLPRVLDFEPDIVFYQSGVDGLESDVLGHLSLTLNGLKRRDSMVMSAVLEQHVPFVITLGGGYSDPITLTAEAHANTFRTAAAIFDGATHVMP
ncbi:MAG: histone deacetylase [Acidobacteriales bacterium]|nr:histone deacetylase [Terriglobales bacterium]